MSNMLAIQGSPRSRLVVCPVMSIPIHSRLSFWAACLDDDRPPRGGTESRYRTLLADCGTAFEKTKSSSENFNAVLADVPAGLSKGKRSSLVASAASAYEDAREELATAVAKLNQFLMSKIIPSRPALKAAAMHAPAR